MANDCFKPATTRCTSSSMRPFKDCSWDNAFSTSGWLAPKRVLRSAALLRKSAAVCSRSDICLDSAGGVSCLTRLQVSQHLTLIKTTVSSKGQIVLPAEFRQMDFVEPGQEFDVERLDRGDYRLRRREAPPNEGAIDWRSIATVESGPPMVIMGAEDPATPFPTFARDEIARFFESASDERNVRAAPHPEGS